MRHWPWRVSVRTPTRRPPHGERIKGADKPTRLQIIAALAALKPAQEVRLVAPQAGPALRGQG